MLVPKIFNSSVIAAQSTREGGVSPAPFYSLNLGMSVNDLEENVVRNRELFFSSLDIPLEKLSKSHQVHGTGILKAIQPGATEGYDAQITDVPGLFLVVSVADCVPVLIHDEKNNAVAAIHAGWRGTAGQIVLKTLQRMKEEYNTEAKDCKAFIGACISYKNFEVGEEVAINFDERFKKYDDSLGKWFVDLKGANKDQLMKFGISEGHVEVSGFCTVEDNDRFFSHRKEQGRTGRMMAVIGRK
jgi:YfiH family protein